MKKFDKDKICCANCIYFDKFPEQKKEENLLGACKANPPFPALPDSETKLGHWPLVLGSWSCGVFSNGSIDK